MSKTVITNIAWVAIAAGAFIAGKAMQKSADSGISATGTPQTASAPKAPAARDTEAPKAAKEGNATSALAWLNSFRGADGKISPQRMADAVDEAMKETDLVKSSMYFAQLLEELSPENAATAFKTVRERAVGFDGMRFMPLLGYAWGQIDGKAALAAFDAGNGGGPGGRGDGWMKSSVMAGWAANDPDAAITYNNELKAKQAAEAAANGEEAGGRGRGRGGWGGDDGLERGIVSGLSRRSIDEAMAYVGKLEQNRRGEFVGIITEQKMRDGVQGAAVWAQSITDSGMKGEALESVGRQYSRQDLPGAAGWATTVSAVPEAREAVEEVAERFAETNLTEAYTWAKGLSGAGQKEAYGEVFERWAQKDVLAASTELDKLPQGEAKDGAIQALSRNLAREEPQDAIAWATSISNAEDRQQAQMDVTREWFQKDQAAAQQWISANLPAEAQEQATQQPDRGRWGRGGPPFGR